MTLRPPNGHPSSCPCPTCNDYDPTDDFEREEARLESWREDPPDARERDQAPDAA